MAERCHPFQDDAQLIKSKQTERIIHSAVVSEKIVCPVCLKADAKKPKFFLPGTGLQQHFRAMHRQRYDVSQEVAGKELIQKLHGEETRELLTILSNQRKSQVILIRHLYFCVLFFLNNKNCLEEGHFL